MPLDGHATPADAAHLLARLTFGPRPGQAEALAGAGLAAWLDAQLRPDHIADPAGAAALAPFRDALAPPADLEDAAQQELADMPRDGDPARGKQAKNRARRALVLETQMTVIARHVASERAVLEVLTELWTNHFSVSLQKGKVRYLAADFVETAVRPFALGRFADLLKATARHPAMLVYLDNAQSVAPRPGTRPAQRGRGLNENYARELLELHTLGVDGGYTQADVVAVARVLSGWGVTGDGAFAFHPRLHDDAAKVVLGHDFPAGGGEQEGVRLLDLLAAHPSTIRHVCSKLCVQLVADTPPAAAIEAAAAAWRATGGHIAEVVRAIVRAPVFWRPEYRNNKIKSPLELVVSAVRAVGGEVEGTGLAKVLGKLGQPPLLAPAPTGYADASAAWLSTAGALERMDFALGLAAERLPGVRLALDPIVPLPGSEPIAAWRSQTVARIARLIPGGLTPATRGVIEAWIARPRQPTQARTLALALALASPEFQRQ
ncbi:MAG TPA: DUF1800 domain-containing protein [Kofleriaceae bacterium]|nr:DUF1800 domain-containing protein [Kofleriaceae bacterium]